MSARASIAFEYTHLRTEGLDDKVLIQQMNALGQEGWMVAGQVGPLLVFQRAVAPTPVGSPFLDETSPRSEDEEQVEGPDRVFLTSCVPAVSAMPHVFRPGNPFDSHGRRRTE